MTPLGASKRHVDGVADARRYARPSTHELRILRCLDEQVRRGAITPTAALESFITQAAHMRRVSRPRLVITNASAKKMHRRATGALLDDKETVALSAPSWEALLHEWCHWLHAQRGGWNNPLLRCTGADTYAEGFARAYMHATATQLPPVLAPDYVAQVLCECGAAASHPRRIAACVLLNLNELAVRMRRRHKKVEK